MIAYAIRYKLNKNYFYLSFITLGFPTGLWRDFKYAKKYENESDALNDIERLKANGFNTKVDPVLEVVTTQQVEEELKQP